MPTAPPARSPAAWQGPLRAAIAVFVVGFFVVWLVKPIGNPCPDLGSLPQGSSASSSPSLSPPGSRTCTYTASAGIEATSKYMPWLDWIVLLLVAAAVAGVVRAISPAGRGAREPRAERAPRGEPEPRGEREPRAERPPRPSRQPRASSTPEPSPDPGAAERDAAARERARQERAARRSR